MKIIIITVLILAIFFPLAYADLKTYEVDLDNNSKDEFIAVYQPFELPENTLPFTIEGIVAVYKRTEVKKIGQFSMPGHLEKVEFIRLNKDSVKQIVAWSSSGMHMMNLAIYGFNNRLHKIFEAGTGTAIMTDFNSTPPVIKVGVARFDKKG